MRPWVRRVRAAVRVGLLWAAAWFAVGMVMLAIIGPDAADVPFPLGFGLLGLLAGATFSALLTVGERRRRFDQMSLARFAGWGALGGVALAGLLSLVAGGEFAVLATVFALAGGGSAAGSLLLARKGEALDPRAGTAPAKELEGSTQGEE